MDNVFLFTSESVTEGHPDKLCDQISDRILDAMLEEDPDSFSAVEVLASRGMFHVAGEVKSSARVDVDSLVREVVASAGYTSSDLGLDAATCGVSVSIGAQSQEIRDGVTSSLEARESGVIDEDDTQGAGDQGIMFGYAANETRELMPLPIMFAHRLAERLAFVRKNGIVPSLRPDGKTQVTVAYDRETRTPVGIDTIVVSTQHDPGVSQEFLESAIIQNVVNPVFDDLGLPFGLDDTKIVVNPSGSFVHGGPGEDAGLCLASGSLVNVRERGLVPIEDVKIGDSVTTPSGFATVVDHFDNGVKDTVVVSDSCGFRIHATPQHPFRVKLPSGDLVWKLAGDLVPGDVLVRHYDSSLVEDSVSDEELDSAFVTGLLTRLYDYPNLGDEVDTDSLLRNAGVTVRSHDASPLFDGVPQSILEGSDDLKFAFMRGMLALPYETLPNGEKHVEFVSRKLAQQCASLLWSVGITAHLRELDRGTCLLFNGSVPFSGISFSEVVGIGRSSDQTWDITLDDNEHAFIAEGFVVHNTGRKIIVDTYGGAGRHGGGNFHGKDCSKVDRSAAYALRWVAKNIVASGLADRAEVQVSYAIGKSAPVSLMVDTFGTSTVPEDVIEEVVRRVFDLRPAAIVRELDLKRPIFYKTSVYGHFGRELPEFTWERTDKVEDILRVLADVLSEAN